MNRPEVDAGSLGQNLSCRAALVGAVTGNFPCDVTAVFVPGASNSTTVSISGNARERNPEVNFVVRVPREPESGTSYSWMEDVLSAELLVHDMPSGNSFVASKGLMIDPATFTYRVGEVTGRLTTGGGGAEFRVTQQLDVTLKPTMASPAPNNVRVSIAVTK
jgi:hypothetical protein